jgi:hypothetical protein
MRRQVMDECVAVYVKTFANIMAMMVCFGCDD